MSEYPKIYTVKWCYDVMGIPKEEEEPIYVLGPFGQAVRVR